MVQTLNVASLVSNQGEIELRDSNEERERGRDDYKFDIPHRV